MSALFPPPPPLRQVSFNVNGTPAPQGSKKAIPLSKKGADGVKVFTGKVNVIESAKSVKPWRASVATAARQALKQPIEGAVNVGVVFYLKRPKDHYRTGRFAGQLSPKAPTYPGVKPDLDKLLRSTLDALTTARAYKDDAVVVDVTMAKRYADHREPGATIHIIQKAAA